MMERLPDLRLDWLVDQAIALPGWPQPFTTRIAGPDGASSALRDALLAFFEDRLETLLREQGATAPEVAAVLANGAAWHVAEVPKRLAAVRAFADMPESAALAAANKRIANILRKSDAGAAARVDPALFVEGAERALHAALGEVAPRADALFEQREYAASLRKLAALKAPVDAFFDQVLVNADDAALRNNRLALLATLHAAMNRVADLARLAN
jgi:glycyl-tRNA synthetase beta chain